MNLDDCSISPKTGVGELKVLWKDSNFDPQQRAFYYARVLENPWMPLVHMGCAALEHRTLRRPVGKPAGTRLVVAYPLSTLSRRRYPDKPVSLGSGRQYKVIAPVVTLNLSVEAT